MQKEFKGLIMNFFCNIFFVRLYHAHSSRVLWKILIYKRERERERESSKTCLLVVNITSKKKKKRFVPYYYIGYNCTTTFLPTGAHSQKKNIYIYIFSLSQSLFPLEKYNSLVFYQEYFVFTFFLHCLPVFSSASKLKFIIILKFSLYKPECNFVLHKPTSLKWI